jgi:hypothetical protein
MEWLNVLKYVALAEGTELYKYAPHFPLRTLLSTLL